MPTEPDHHDCDCEPGPRSPTGAPVQARVALATALTGLVVLLAVSSTVQGTSALAHEATHGDTVAVFVASFGFAAGVLISTAGLILSLQPIARDHGRRTALSAASLTLASPVVITAVAALR